MLLRKEPRASALARSFEGKMHGSTVPIMNVERLCTSLYDEVDHG